MVLHCVVGSTAQMPKTKPAYIHNSSAGTHNHKTKRHIYENRNTKEVLSLQTHLIPQF
jgi:hypothetical protein